jgi:iron(III) transport system substrate-binding protein
VKKISLLLSIIAYLTNFIFISVNANEVNIFSARHYDSDVQLYEKFTNKTGIKVNVVSGKSGALEKRIIEEGSDSKADLYITADAGRLGAFKAKGMLQGGLNTSAIKSAVSSNFRTSQWVGLTYESLANPRWKGRLVIRKSNNIYNQSLVASLITNNGKGSTAEWAKGVVSNMARTPKGNDRAQILAVAAGEADIAVANTYYLALMLSGKKGPEQQAAAKKVKPFFPNQNDRGTHMNISGAGLVKGAPNKTNAIKLVEFLLSKEAQEHIVNNTFEYPMISSVLPHPLVINMGLDFKQDLKTKVVNYGKKQADALEVMTEAGWK